MLKLTANIILIVGLCTHASQVGAQGQCWENTQVFPNAISLDYPVVLVPGFMGFEAGLGVDYFYGVRDALESKGVQVFEVVLSPVASSEHRALELGSYLHRIVEEQGIQKFHLIVHSQGGLDARVLLSYEYFSSLVVDVITVATPHRGTPVTDALLEEGDATLISRTVEWLGEGAAQVLDSNLESPEGSMREALEAVSEAGSEKIEHRYANVNTLPIYSVAGHSSSGIEHGICENGTYFSNFSRSDTLNFALRATGAYLESSFSTQDVRYHDGLIPLSSQVYGEFLGCIPADHWDQVGQPLGPSHWWTGFDHINLYLALVDYLAQKERGAEAPQCYEQ